MASQININDFTLEELEKLELITGLNFSEIGDNFGRPKVIKAVLWINELRTNPDAKIEDFGKLTLAEASTLFVGEDPKE
jgi:hypothetical protein